VNPLLLVDWARLHRAFRALMWLTAVAMACLILVEGIHGGNHGTTAKSARMVAPRR
jgi:hypothetical protein